MRGVVRRRAALLLLLASCAAPRVPPPPDDTPWLELELPARVRSSVPLAELRGRVAGVPLAGADVVLVIDLTNTTYEASGVDADGDGKIGVDRPWAKQVSGSNVRWQRPVRTWTTDYGDAIVSVELETARKLVGELAARHCRVGIVTFTGRPRVVARVGPPEEARAALDRLRVPVDGSGTLPKLALRRAARLLAAAERERGPRRRPVVVFLSDGAETNRDQQRVRSDAERAAEQMARAGIEVHALGFGKDEAEDPEPMSRIAAFGGGRYLHVDRPDEALALLDPVLPIAEVPVANRALPEAAPRALRTFVDGTFDGFVPLAPGSNEIELEVVLEDGRRVRARREVVYEPLDAPAIADADLLRALRERTAETELAGQSQAGPARRRTLLEVHPEPEARDGESAGSP
jgi:hypothetical protein